MLDETDVLLPRAKRTYGPKGRALANRVAGGGNVAEAWGSGRRGDDGSRDGGSGIGGGERRKGRRSKGASQAADPPAVKLLRCDHTRSRDWGEHNTGAHTHTHTHIGKDLPMCACNPTTVHECSTK